MHVTVERDAGALGKGLQRYDVPYPRVPQYACMHIYLAQYLVPGPRYVISIPGIGTTRFFKHSSNWNACPMLSVRVHISPVGVDGAMVHGVVAVAWSLPCGRYRVVVVVVPRTCIYMPELL